MFLTRSATIGRLQHVVVLAGKSRARMLPGGFSSVETCSHAQHPSCMRRHRLFSSSDACTAAFVEDEDANQETTTATTTNTVVDYFSLLGVSRRFLLDPKELQNSYRQLMTQHHPDMRNQRQASDDDDDDDEDIASKITHAYYTLRKPHTRATHLLELVGRPMEEETVNAASLVGPGFLMHVMELRETIDSVAEDINRNGGEDNQDAIRELEEILATAQEEMEEVLKELDNAFQHELLDKALELSAQLQYLHRIEETIQEKL